jgi:uncharacterized protein YeaO (DUF488 family)
MSATKPGSGEVKLKRAYERATGDDGMRVLVDRLWPRGLDKRQVAAALWLKDAAPSERLRRWYGHDPRRWERFRAEYRAELAQRADILALLADLRRRGTLTLVYGARDEAHNQAVVLREVLEERGFARQSPSQRSRTKPGARKGAPR